MVYMAKKFTITLGRECGAGATLIAQTLSEDLNIPYYDKDIFRMVSDRSGVLEEFFHVNNERPGNNLLYKCIKDLNPKQQKPSLGKDIVSPDNLFRFQSELILELAENETCMIVGRCADYILKDHDNVVCLRRPRQQGAPDDEYFLAGPQRGCRTHKRYRQAAPEVL